MHNLFFDLYMTIDHARMHLAENYDEKIEGKGLANAMSLNNQLVVKQFTEMHWINCFLHTLYCLQVSVVNKVV